MIPSPKMKPHERILRVEALSIDGSSLTIRLKDEREARCDYCGNRLVAVFIQPWASGEGQHIRMQCLDCDHCIGFLNKANYEWALSRFKFEHSIP